MLVREVVFRVWVIDCQMTLTPKEIVNGPRGCGACIDSHEKILREAGLTAEQIQASVRIASTVHAVAVAIESEAHVGTVAA